MLTVEKKTNNYVHHESVYKGRCRDIIKLHIDNMFKGAKTLNTFTLGGTELRLEKMLQNDYKLKGVSYEFEPNSVEIARNNAPKGIEIVEGNIFNHKYKGTEQVIWFDFMTALRPRNVKELINWIDNNKIKDNCIFVVTYTLHSRNVKGEGYRQLFNNEIEHNNFIINMKNKIASHLENENVGIKGQISTIRYCNLDISKHSLPMVQFIFDLSKK